MSLNVSGIAKDDVITAVSVLLPWQDALSQSGYNPNFSDFAGFVPFNGGAGRQTPLTLLFNGFNGTGMTGPTNGLDITFNHAGGTSNFQLGHGINLSVNFTPLAGTVKGMQSQKITGTVFGAGASGGGIDAATLDSLDLSSLIDPSRTGTSGLIMGLSSAAHKLNAVDDTAAGGTLIGGQFIASINAGKTSDIVGAQCNPQGGSGTTAVHFYGLQVLDPLALGTITTRAAAIEVGNWSTASFFSAPRGMAFHASGGDLVLDSGDAEFTSNATGPIVHSPNNSRYRVVVNNAGTLSTQGPL